MKKAALENIRVLDFGRIIAGPFCSYLLQELGAEVIKVEIPVGGDTFRTFAPLTGGGESYCFIIFNRGKKSITLNLESERGREITKELVKKADVLVENFNNRALDKLGLRYEVLKKINPQLIHASISGFGHTGPRSSQSSVDIVAQAAGGLMSVTGFPDNPPTRAGISLGDYLSGLYAATAILAALRHREKTGEGQHIDISMQDCIWAVVAGEYLPIHCLFGNQPIRSGNAHPQFTPYNTYATVDGYVVICTPTQAIWGSLLRVIGRADLIGVLKYSTPGERIKYKDEVETVISEWTKTRTKAEVVNELNNAEVACSQVLTIDEAANDPQLLSRDMIIEVEQPISGNLKVPGPVFKLSETPGNASSPAPFLGQHNYEVYSNLLGYSEQQVRKLEDDGII
jgi:CoA:oxalate CoA-transferase